MKPDGIRGGGASYPGKPSCPIVDGCPRRRSAELTRSARSGEVAEGGRSAGSTEETGPMKPGNSVEEKTLRRGTGRGTPNYPGSSTPSASSVWRKSRTKGDSDRVEESTQSGGAGPGNKKGYPNPEAGIPIGERRVVIRGPVQAKGHVTARPSLTSRPNRGEAK